MARPLRIQYEGGLYHVTLRGNERKAIVRDEDDRHRFVDALGASVLRHGVILHLHCLMDNHAHLVVETPHANLMPSCEFQRANRLFTVATAFWAPDASLYGARLVSRPLSVSAHPLLHLNPVRTRPPIN